jgi:DNA-binding LacI/PurR family transcriptional regulator
MGGRSPSGRVSLDKSRSNQYKSRVRALPQLMRGNDPLPAGLIERRAPVVAGGRPPGDGRAISHVDGDNRTGAVTAVRRLAS